MSLSEIDPTTEPQPPAEVPERPPLDARLEGLLLGTAVGDALGLPAEGLSPRRIRALGWDRWRHRLLFGRGMLSDDTEHTLFVAQALLASRGDPARFERRLAWKLRLWLLGLPAGVGLATGRAIIKLWLGIPPRWSGVRSAGNGPAMRSAVIGAFCANNLPALRELTRRSTRLTHTDPRALTGATAVAIAAAFATNNGGPAMFPTLLLGLRAVDPRDREWQGALDRVAEGLRAGWSVAELAEEMGLGRGVGGYVYHTVPVALYAWLHHFGDFRGALQAVFDCGGDTDTVGAICGALAGATVLGEGVPAEWIDGIGDWPRTPGLLREVALRLAAFRDGADPGPVGYPWPGLIPRNLLFFVVVLAHGLLRLLPAAVVRRLIP